MPVRLTPEIITAAIRGFEEQKRHIDGQIAELQATLSGGPAEPAAMPDGATRKRKISAAARRRMALGQQARWAKIRGESGHPEPATPEPAKPKRKLSEAGRANIVAALKKRWAAQKAAAKKAGPAAAKKVAVKKAAKKKGGPAKKAKAAKKTVAAQTATGVAGE